MRVFVRVTLARDGDRPEGGGRTEAIGSECSHAFAIDR